MGVADAGGRSGVNAADAYQRAAALFGETIAALADHEWEAATGDDWTVVTTVAWVVVALVVAAALALRKLGGVPDLRSLSTLWLVLLAVQVTLGATSVWTGKAVPITAAHLAVGGLLWITGVLASVLLARLQALSTAPATTAAGAGETAPVPA